MAQIPGSVRITGFIAPSDTTDTYAVTDELYNRGGYRSVTDQSERLAITSDRRKIGMLVKQLSDNTYWTLNGGIDNDNWVVETFNFSGGTEITGTTTYKKVSFGNIVTNNFTYPVTYGTSIGSSFGEKYHRHIRDNYVDHNKFLFDIYCENGIKFIEQQFPTTNDMVVFLDTNLPRVGFQTVRYTIDCYAKESPTLGAISKVYGMNLFYSVLKGTKNYKKKIKTLYDGVYSASGKFETSKNALVTALWNHFTYVGFMESHSLDDGAKSIWFPQTNSNIYGLLHSGNTIIFGGITGDRMCFCWGDSNFVLQGANTMKVVDSVIVGLNVGHQDFYLFNVFRDLDYFNNYSYVVVYKLQGKDVHNDDITALYVKPIGQDTFRLNYVPDITNKDLYIMYYEGDNDHQPIIKRLTSVNKHNDIGGDVSFLVNKTDWNVRPHVANGAMSRHFGHSKMKSFRFFIGDMQGNISSFSPEITPYIFRNGAKLITLISKI
jgi:hypothetical protein